MSHFIDIKDTVRLHFLPASAIMPGDLICFGIDDEHARSGEVSDVYLPGTQPENPAHYVIKINEGKDQLVAAPDTAVSLLRARLVGNHLTALQRAGLSLLDDINAQGGLYEREGNVDIVEDWDEEGWPDLAQTALDTLAALRSEGVKYACLVMTRIEEATA